MTRPRVLVADDKPNILSLLGAVLGDFCEVTSTGDGQHALALALAGDFDVVVADIRMPGLDGFGLLRELKRVKPDVEVVLMTAFGSIEKAVAAMRVGAYHYLTKPFDNDEALMTVERAAERKRLRTEARNLREALAASSRFDQLVGKTAKMQLVFDLLRSASASNANVLVTGERGTGKRAAARAIHDSSSQPDAPFVVINCAAMQELPEAELTNALHGVALERERAASAERRGVVLFEELGALSLQSQAKLAQALRADGKRGVEVADSVRVLATSSLDLKAEIGAGRFREDLYYRLGVLRIHMPPLCERKEDIPVLSAHFLELHGRRYAKQPEGFMPEALSALVRYDWPGNVRELENAIERALVVIEGDRIPEEALPDEIRQNVSGGVLHERFTYSEAVELARDRASREYLTALMREFGGSVTRAAERAGVERESLHRLLKRYGLRSNEFKPPD